MAAYSAAGRNELAQAANGYRRTTAQFEELLRNGIARIDELNGKYAQLRSSVAAEEVLAASYEERSKKLRETVDALSKTVKANEEDMAQWKEQVRKAAHEAFDLTMVQKLWADRARDAQIAFYVSVGLLFVFLILVPLWAFYNVEAIGRGLTAIGNLAVPPKSAEPTAVELTAYALTRLASISFPIALYFWIVRLVVRFANRSILLQDDARARDTMLQTYYRLIEGKGAAPKEDRAIILSSLFRPIPGHGQEANEPPNINEVVHTVMPQLPAKP